MWIKLPVEGPLVDVEGEPTLEELQEAVGGYVEPVDTWQVVVWLNEEGSDKDLPPNPREEPAPAHRGRRGADGARGPRR